MTPGRARKIDISAAALCGGFVGTASGLAVVGTEVHPLWPVLLAIVVAATAAATAAALIAYRYACIPLKTTKEP